MQNNGLVAIESKQGVTIFGRTGLGGKLGQFEVICETQGNNGNIYTMYSDAEGRRDALITMKNSFAYDRKKR